MKKLSKISTYGLILYLALMMCCVQSAFLHHGMHQSDKHHSHSAQVNHFDDNHSKLVSGHHVQTESALFKSIFSLEILSGIVLIFLFIFRSAISPVNVLISFIKRHKYKRRWRSYLLSSSIGLRSPPNTYVMG